MPPQLSIPQDQRYRASSAFRPRFVAVVAALAASSCVAGARAGEPGKVDFGREILPILTDNCLLCHGPDAKTRKADLRLDAKEAALRSKHPVIVPGRSDESELFHRIQSVDPDEKMPPPKSGRTLSNRQIELLGRWIDEGAHWDRHWSLEPPRRPAPPPVRDQSWARNPIDQFVLAGLEKEALTPAPEAARTTLIRRLTLDLTGLPPTPTEVDEYIADSSPNAYEKVVDRLLHSPRFGERMASRWLDAARYADTNGYQSDGERFMWRWRDWVIDAYNRNLAFDQFTIEQLAGDLLPKPTLDQLIATGFNRNHRGNGEGGIVPEEYAVEYVVDRVETTGTVWLGLTIGCARCHDHKFDPISQREFYQLFAFFNNVPERGKAVKFGNSPPVIKGPTPRQQEELRALESQIAEADKRFQDLMPDLDSAQSAWERTLSSNQSIDWAPTEALRAHFTLDGTPGNSTADETIGRFENGKPEFVPGRLGEAVACDGRVSLNAGDVAEYGFYDKFSAGAWVKVAPDGGGIILSRMVDAARADGYSLSIERGRVQVNLVKRWLDDAIRVETSSQLAPGGWHHVMFTYDGSRFVDGVKVYLDGRLAKLDVLLDDLNQSFQTTEPLRIGGGGGAEGRFRGAIDDVRVYDAALEPGEVALIATSETVSAIAATPPGRRTEDQARKLRAYYLEVEAPQPIQAAWKRSRALRQEKQRLLERIPTTMIMREMDPPRTTHVLLRGAYDKPGPSVTPRVPACLPPLPHAERVNRLALARWFVDGTNPLTARVAVNRQWQMLFGTGIVKTAEDFGVRGDRPSHADLLDWLATEFVGLGWDVKALLREIVTSATYRQSSQVSPELLRRDPENRLLARGPRVRLSAEMIRDQALRMSGLLVERIGGPSVRPYQPAGLWKELTGTEEYQQDTGASLFRRSIYTFWKRTIAPPSMATFDAAGRETCSVREVRTNTPLQALNLMNDVTFVEAARKLGERALIEGGNSDESRLTCQFRLALARRPSAVEYAIVSEALKAHRAHYEKNADAARRLIRLGASEPLGSLDPGELAAYTAVGSLLLNLDESITKE